MRARFCIAAREKDEGTKGARSRARRRAAHIVYMYYSILRFINPRGKLCRSESNPARTALERATAQLLTRTTYPST